MNPQITPTERLLLRNQYQILSYLDPKKENKEWYEEAIEILDSGYEIDYTHVFLSVGSELARNKSEFVIKVLDMFDRIADASENKGFRVPQGAEHRSRFRGFDGNNEGEYMEYAKFVINKQKHFQRFKEQDLNSHAPMIERYGQMLDIFEHLPSFNAPEGLNEDDFKRLLGA